MDIVIKKHTLKMTTLYYLGSYFALSIEMFTAACYRKILFFIYKKGF